MDIIDSQWLIDLIESLKSSGEIYNETDFCKKTGLNKSFVSNMKSGKNQITEQTVLKIKQTFPAFFGIERMEKKELCLLCAEKDKVIATKDALIDSLNKQIELLEKRLAQYEGNNAKKVG